MCQFSSFTLLEAIIICTAAYASSTNLADTVAHDAALVSASTQPCLLQRETSQHTRQSTEFWPFDDWFKGNSGTTDVNESAETSDDSTSDVANVTSIAEQRGNDTADVGTHGKVVVDVFYETRCPHCVNFLNTTLRASFNDAGFWNAVRIKLHPFGNAQFLNAENVSPGYKWWHPKAEFPLLMCQHGEVECLGNKIHACVANLVSNTLHTKFIICMASYGTRGGAEMSSYACGQSLGINMAKVKTCVNSNHSLRLMMSLRNATQAAQVKHVPWIVINGRHVSDEEEFLKPVCAALPASVKTGLCGSLYRKDNTKKHGGSGPCLSGSSTEMSSSLQTARVTTKDAGNMPRNV